MRKTQRTHLFQTIKKNIVSFLSVALMAGTGIAVYLGDQSAAQAILEKANSYYVENKLQSLEITSVYGITEEDIKAISKLEEVDAVEGGYSTISIWDTKTDAGKLLIRVHSLLDSMNIPVVIEGTLPTEENQAAIEQKMAKQEGIQVGDVITVEHDGELKEETFEVTAIINQPAFCCAKSLDTRGVSDKGIGSAYYYIALTEHAFDASYFGNCYTTAYIKNYDLDQYYYFSEEYREKEAELKAKVALVGEDRKESRYKEVLAIANKKIIEVEETLAKYEKELEIAKSLVESLELKGKYQDKMLEELERAQKRLLEGQTALLDTKANILLLEEEDWIVSIRNNIGDVRSINIIVEGLYGLSYSMALIFVVVSIIVCFSAISRMINEQRNLIGMQKALGFTTREILLHYMEYSLICGIVGVLGGWLYSVLTVQSLSLIIYEGVFLLGDIPFSFAWNHAIVIAVVFIVIFMIASYLACKKEISSTAIDLLRGEVLEREKPFFFEKMGFYKKSRLYTRTMIKNVLVDKPRMATTIVGVAGCTLLLVISFTMLLAMQESPVKQFEEYFLYDNRLVIDTDEGDIEKFKLLLDEENIDYMLIQNKLKLYRAPGEDWTGAHIVVTSDTERLKEFMVLENPNTRELVELPSAGMLVSLKCAENYNLKAGSVLEIMDSQGNLKGFTVTGIIEHYLPYNLFVMSEEYYETVMEEDSDQCVFLIKGNVDALYGKVKNIDGFLSLRDNSEYIKMDNALYLIIIICFVFAAIMAVLVMLNQNVMHINRKAKELSVMRINGFTLKETKAFVSRDNVLLTAMGILVGWIVGMLFGYIVVRVLEVSMTHYLRTPSLKACLISGVIGGVFAYIMNKIALCRIKKLNLTNVNAN